jgi:Zn-dependent peptidase ImmA (M78 family)
LKEEADRLKKRLGQLGLSDSVIEAAWPEWWSEDADSSPSASLELRFSLARKLGLDPRSLVDDEGVARFAWRDEARFKNLAGESELERAAIASFGRAIGSMLLEATRKGPEILIPDAEGIRNSILRSQPFVTLLDLLALSWAAGVPVVHLRIFPLRRKRMAAMTVRVGDRSAILLGKDSKYPAQVAFYLAHEIGHIALGHLSQGSTIVDLEGEESSLAVSDSEEKEADEFAMYLLTGKTNPSVISGSQKYNAPGLAEAALRSAEAIHIEAGTLALCFGYSSGNWAVVNSAMRFIYGTPQPIWSEVNTIAMQQLGINDVPSDSRPYLAAVLGAGLAA